MTARPPRHTPPTRYYLTRAVPRLFAVLTREERARLLDDPSHHLAARALHRALTTLDATFPRRAWVELPIPDLRATVLATHGDPAEDPSV